MDYSLHVVDIQSLLENHSVCVCIHSSAGTCAPVIQTADSFSSPKVSKTNKSLLFHRLVFFKWYHEHVQLNNYICLGAAP